MELIGRVRMQTVRYETTKILALAALALGALVACNRTPTNAGHDLPLLLAMRSDTPYISGTIVHREVREDGRLQLLVSATDRESARVPDALVRVVQGALLLWPDGSEASTESLHVGRRVTVWVTGPELRSLPPQVSGNAILLQR